MTPDLIGKAILITGATDGLGRAVAIALVGRLRWDLVSWRGNPRAPRCPMSRHRKDPLRPLTANERQELTRLSRSLSAPAAQVERARAPAPPPRGAPPRARVSILGGPHPARPPPTRGNDGTPRPSPPGSAAST